jgi:hypothetical protein
VKTDLLFAAAVQGRRTWHPLAVLRESTSKQGFRLELNGLTIAFWRETDWADVVVRLTPGRGTLRSRLSTLSENRGDLVMVSTCMRGQTGPDVTTGFGNQGAALAGLVAITGWPDRAPAGPGRVYRFHCCATALRR